MKMDIDHQNLGDGVPIQIVQKNWNTKVCKENGHWWSEFGWDIQIQLIFFTIFLNFKFSTNGDFHLESDYHWLKSVSESSHPQHTAVHRIELTSGLVCCSYSPFFLPQLSFLAELLLWYLTGNILGIEVSCGWHADDLRMMCRWPADDTRVRFRVRFHWRMTYVIWNVIRTLAWVAKFHAVLHLVSSACHPQSKELG